MAFSSGALDLATVCDAYGVGRNMASLDGQSYYDSAGTQRIINCRTNKPFSLGTLRGKYKTIQSGTKSDSSGNSKQTYYAWPYAGVTINCYYNITYSYVPGKVISASIEFGASGGNIGASSNPSVPQFHAYVSIDGGGEIEVTNGNPSNYTTSSITSSLSIRIASYATNDSGANVGGNPTWNLTVNSSGQLV